MHTNTNVQETQPLIGVCYNDIYDNVIISYSSHSLVICHLFLTHNFDYQPEYTDKNKESALSCAIYIKRKGKDSSSVLKYYCRRTEEKAKGKPEFWMKTVVPVFRRLISKYPDSALELMKAMNDLPLNEKIVWSNQEDLYAFTVRQMKCTR